MYPDYVGNDKLTVSYDGITTATSLVATTADINSGTIDATTGVTTPASAIFTTLTSNDALTVNSHAVVTGDNALQTTFKVRGAAGQTNANLVTVADGGNNSQFTISGTGVTTANSLVATTADINGGTIDNVSWFINTIRWYLYNSHCWYT